MHRNNTITQIYCKLRIITCAPSWLVPLCIPSKNIGKIFPGTRHNNLHSSPYHTIRYRLHRMFYISLSIHLMGVLEKLHAYIKLVYSASNSLFPVIEDALLSGEVIPLLHWIISVLYSTENKIPSFLLCFTCVFACVSPLCSLCLLRIPHLEILQQSPEISLCVNITRVNPQFAWDIEAKIQFFVLPIIHLNSPIPANKSPLSHVHCAIP